MVVSVAHTRRAALAAGAAGTACLAGLGALAGDDRSGGGSVSVLAAGSLQRALDTRFHGRVDAQVALESHGSAACARMVREGLRDPDVLALADPALFAGLTERYTAFATNALVVAYAPDTAAGRRVRDAKRALDPILDSDTRWGRTDPDADPLGYRTLFALELARERWNRPYPGALAPEQVFPETDLVGVFEAGALDAAVVYRNMAVDHGVPFRALPPAVNLSAPRFADRYREYAYTLPGGRTVRGAPISYGAALRTDRPAARAVFGALTEGEWLGTGFEVPASYPTVERP